MALEHESSHPSQQKNLIGKIIEVSGTVIDVAFSRQAVPEIFNELQVIIPPQNGNPEKRASVEVAQQLGDGVVRCIALENIFGIYRGLDVVDMGGPIRVPVGDQVLRKNI